MTAEDLDKVKRICWQCRSAANKCYDPFDKYVRSVEKSWGNNTETKWLFVCDGCKYVFEIEMLKG